MTTMQHETPGDVCSVCGKEVAGGFTVQESEVEDGGGFAIVVAGTPQLQRLRWLQRECTGAVQAS
ncbi:MAG: hypothetical protein ABSC02_10300 [Acidobacteriota bacterium]